MIILQSGTRSGVLTFVVTEVLIYADWGRGGHGAEEEDGQGEDVTHHIEG